MTQQGPRTALVTGGTGFFGRHLVRRLREDGWQLVCLARRPLVPVDEGVRWVQGDLLAPRDLQEQLRNVGPVEAVFHLGAVLPLGGTKEEYFLTGNGLATMALLGWSRSVGHPPFVYASSISVIGKPTQLPVTEEALPMPDNPYSLGKLWGEEACEMERRLHHAPVTSLRVTSLYGPGMGRTVLSHFVQQSLRDEPVEWMGEGARSQNFLHVEDAVDACLLAAGASKGGVYNIGGANSTSMRDLGRLVVRSTKASRSEARSKPEEDPQADLRWDIDTSRAAKELGYVPRKALESGLRDYIESVREGDNGPMWWKQA